MNLLINPNPKDDLNSLSTALAQRLVDKLGGDTTIVRIYDHPQNYFRYEFNQEWIELVKRADHVIIPVQMWNFTIPAALKDFFDKITQHGQLWKLSDDKKSFVGLLKDKTVYVIMTSGFEYPPGSPQDFVVPYIKVFFDFLGIRDVRDFRIGNVARSKELIANSAYMQEKTDAMLSAFSIKK